jgi:hypothetical protein
MYPCSIRMCLVVARGASGNCFYVHLLSILVYIAARILHYNGCLLVVNLITSWFFYLCIYVVYQFNRPGVHVPPSGNLVVSMRPLKPADAIKATVCINIIMLGLRS